MGKGCRGGSERGGMAEVLVLRSALWDRAGRVHYANWFVNYAKSRQSGSAGPRACPDSRLRTAAVPQPRRTDAQPARPSSMAPTRRSEWHSCHSNCRARSNGVAQVEFRRRCAIAAARRRGPGVCSRSAARHDHPDSGAPLGIEERPPHAPRSRTSPFLSLAG